VHPSRRPPALCDVEVVLGRSEGSVPLPYVSAELKTRISEFLAEQQQPRRVWEIANAVGYSDSRTRWALQQLIAEGIVERLTGQNLFNPAQGRASTGFDEHPIRPGYRYRLCSTRPQAGIASHP
jgi:hypothetical protein